MAREKETPLAAQGQPSAADAEKRDAPESNAPEKREAKHDEPVFYEGTITKLVEREVEDKDGKKTKEWVEVMSDNLYPGEKLKSEVDAEDAEKKAEKLRNAPNDGGAQPDDRRYNAK